MFCTFSVQVKSCSFDIENIWSVIMNVMLIHIVYKTRDHAGTAIKNTKCEFKVSH